MSRRPADQKSSVFSDQASVRSLRKADRRSNKTDQSELDNDQQQQRHHHRRRHARQTGDGHSEYSHSQSVGSRHRKDDEPHTWSAKFDQTAISKLIDDVLTTCLAEVTYDPESGRKLSLELSTKILARVKELRVRRFKFVALVTVGSRQQRPALMFGSRCLWDAGADRYASGEFMNASVFAVAVVYGIYFE